MRALAAIAACALVVAASAEDDIEVPVPESIVSAIGILNEQISGIYGELLEEDSTAGGCMTLSFDVMPDGSLWNIEIEADSSLLPIVPAVRSMMTGVEVDLETPRTTPLPVTVPMQLARGSGQDS